MKKKILIVFLVVFQSLTYLIVKQFQTNPHVLGSFLDDKIIFIPQFVYFYIFWYFLLFYVPFYLIKTDKFYTYFKSNITSIIIACIIFIIYPTTIIRDTVITSNISTYLVNLIYKIDTPVLNCLPSIHCILSFLFIFSVMKEKKSFNKYFIIISSTLVILSTVFIKQHVIIDIVLAFFISYIVFKIFDKKTFNIEILKQYKKIYIVSHKNYDADSIISSYLFSNILNKHNIKNEILIIKSDNYEDKKLLNDHLKYKYKEFTNSKNKYFVLLDHNNSIQSIKDDSRVVGVIDHHYFINEKENFIYKNYSSTAVVLYMLFKNIYKFNKYEKKLILLSILSDTAFLKSTRYSFKNKLIFHYLNKNIKLNAFKYENKYFEKTNFSKKSAFNSNYKEYILNNTLIQSSYVKAYESDLKYKPEFIKKLDKLNNYLFIWYDFTNKKTEVYFKKDKIYKLKYNKIRSRGKKIVKKIEKLM